VRGPFLVIVAVGAVVVVATATLAATPARVVDTTAYEFGSAAGGGWLAWSRGNTHGGDYDLHVRQGAQPSRVLEAGQFQEVGNIEIGGPHGDVLVYAVRPWTGDTNIRFYDLATGQVSGPPAGINTIRDEDNPAIDGDHLLFGRGPADGVFSTRVLLYTFTTGVSTVLASAPPGGSVTPDDVAGDLVTYTVCPSSGRCNVVRYRISTGGTVRMPNPQRANYWSSVRPDGTVYFVQGSPTATRRSSATGPAP
jgi:hypothetical protein